MMGVHHEEVRHMATTLPFPGHEPGPPSEDGVLCIDCDECVLQGTEACGDCVITFLCGGIEDAPVVVDLAEARAMRILDDAGLAPPLRHSPRPRRTG